MSDRHSHTERKMSRWQRAAAQYTGLDYGRDEPSTCSGCYYRSDCGRSELLRAMCGYWRIDQVRKNRSHRRRDFR